MAGSPHDVAEGIVAAMLELSTWINIRGGHEQRTVGPAPRQQGSSGTWGPDDYDVIWRDRGIRHIFKPGAGAPPDHPWMWTITGAVVAPHVPSHGFCATLDEAKAKFAETWRAWLALNR